MHLRNLIGHELLVGVAVVNMVVGRPWLLRHVLWLGRGAGLAVGVPLYV